MKTQRDAFFESLYRIAQHDHDVVLVSADMGAPALDRFRRDLAHQYVDVGIAEQQAILVAAGLALGGMKALVYGIAPFITLRCFEQIRVDLAAQDLPVTVIGVGAGLSYEESGPTHHAVEDLTCLRTLPNFTIQNCSDAVMAGAMPGLALASNHPIYVRLDRQALPAIYEEGRDFSGGLQVLREGGRVLLAATGNMVHSALALARDLAAEGLQAGVLDVHRFPIDADRFSEATRGARELFTLEEHTLAGGLGSAVAEILADRRLPLGLTRMGCDFGRGFCYEYGGRERLQEIHGLGHRAMRGRILEAIR